MPSRLLVTGGEQRENAAWHEAFHHYRKGVLAEVDFETRSVERTYEHVTAPEHRSDPMPSIVFKSATLANGRLYLSTETEVLVLSYPELRPLRHLTHPAFNDVHHVVPWQDGLMVVSTGLDVVIVFDAEYRAVQFPPVLGYTTESSSETTCTSRPSTVTLPSRMDGPTRSSARSTSRRSARRRRRSAGVAGCT
jgi:hypothetical protein